MTTTTGTSERQGHVPRPRPRPRKPGPPTPRPAQPHPAKRTAAPREQPPAPCQRPGSPTLAPGVSGGRRLGHQPTNEKRPRLPRPPQGTSDQPSYAAPFLANWPRPTLRNRAAAPLVVASRVIAAYKVAAGVLPFGLDQ